MGGMMIFGSYLPQEISITRCVLIIIVIDTAVALMAGLMIFPMVFRFGLDPAGGPGLIFQTLPVAFGHMPGGDLVAILFFTLLSVAAVASMVGFLEPLIAWIQNTRHYSRHKSPLITTACIACLGVLSILSYNILSHWQLGSRNLNGFLDALANQIMHPVGGLLIAIFAGWQVNKASLRDKLPAMPKAMFEARHHLLRFLLPPAIAVIIITGFL